jgi:SAM-dependent methyltransferase
MPAPTREASNPGERRTNARTVPWTTFARSSELLDAPATSIALDPARALPTAGVALAWLVLLDHVRRQKPLRTGEITMARYSYSSATTGVLHRAAELFHLARTLPRTTNNTVRYVRRIFEETRSRVYDATGVKLEGKRGLDIGPGQQLGCLRCFSLSNDVVGIDTDVIPSGFDPMSWLRMFRSNTEMRVVKTLARKALGVDHRFRKALASELGVNSFPRERVLCMSATQMGFEDQTFDFAYSHSVFEHIDDPAAALSEVRRVLRPGGVAYVSVHLFTSHSGSHDPKIFADGTPHAPFWPHLRPALVHTVRPSTYLNRLSLDAWRELFDRVMPGAVLQHVSDEPHVVEALRTLRREGELAGYSDDELLTVDLIAVWQKPRAIAVPIGAAPKAHSQVGGSGGHFVSCRDEAARVSGASLFSSQPLPTNAELWVESFANSTPSESGRNPGT